jgi:hypothetical protein
MVICETFLKTNPFSNQPEKVQFRRIRYREWMFLRLDEKPNVSPWMMYGFVLMPLPVFGVNPSSSPVELMEIEADDIGCWHVKPAVGEGGDEMPARAMIGIIMAVIHSIGMKTSSQGFVSLFIERVSSAADKKILGHNRATKVRFYDVTRR